MADYISSPIKLTISILVSNRIRYIRRVMDAIKPLLLAVPSELIAIDTKGAESDGSIEIVREYTDNIYSFPWCNDFAAARNVGIKHAKGEWFLYLDDDEVFDDVQELIDFFQTGEYLQYGSGYYYVKNHLAQDSSDSVMEIVGRMIRRTKNTKFVGKVHEHFNEVHKPLKEFSCFVHHYGYLFQNEEERKQHQIRNVTLLKQELKEQGMTPRNCAQMVQELYFCEDTREQGFQFCMDSMKQLKEKGLLEDACSQWILVASVRYFKIKQDYAGAVAQANQIRKEYPQSQMGQMALAGLMVELSAPKGNVSCILEYAPLYMQAWDWLQTHKKEAITQNQLGLSNYGKEEYAIQVFQAAAVCANAVQDYELANQFWLHLPWGKEGFDGSLYEAGVQETKEGLQQIKEEKKKELLELISVLKEAKPVISNLLKTKQREEAIELLTTMQEVMIVFGNKTEELFGENQQTKEVVLILEQCCELVWQSANAELAEDSISILNQIEQKIVFCENKINHW